MTARHWYPFYPSDYARDCRDLTWEQHGAYRLLLDATWERDSCSLPNDLIRIRRMLPAVDLRTFKRLVPYLLERFFCLNEAGEYVNKRLLKEREKANNASLKHSENIKKRWENKGAADTNVILPQLQPQPDSKKEKEAPAKRRVLSALADDWKPDWELTLAQEAELVKMRDWARGGAIRKADWLATFRNWLRRANIPLGNVVAMREVIHIQEGSAEMAAWDSYLRKTTGKNAMRSPKHGGYFPPTRWPPGHEEVA